MSWYIKKKMKKGLRSHHAAKAAGISLSFILLVILGIVLYRRFFRSGRVFVGELEQRNGKKAEVTIIMKVNGTGKIDFGHDMSTPDRFTYDETTMRLIDPKTNEPASSGSGVSTYVIKDDKLIISKDGKEVGTLTLQ